MATKMWSNLSSTKETGEMINLIEYPYKTKKNTKKIL